MPATSYPVPSPLQFKFFHCLEFLQISFLDTPSVTSSPKGSLTTRLMSCVIKGGSSSTSVISAAFCERLLGHQLFSIYCEGSASIGIILSTTCRVHWTSFSPTICSELSLCCSTLTLPTKLPANHPESLHVHTWTETQHQSQWQISDSCWDAWRISGVWLDKFFF